MYIRNEPELFLEDETKDLCKTYLARHIIDTEYKGIRCAVFYGAIKHPKSGSLYFAINKTKDYKKWKNAFHVTDGKFIEEQKFDAIIADNGDVIYSRYKNDHRVSDDGSVSINGGRRYTRCTKVNAERRPTLTVFRGRVEYWEKYSN